jgi:hypothetical protein
MQGPNSLAVQHVLQGSKQMLLVLNKELSWKLVYTQLPKLDHHSPLQEPGWLSTREASLMCKLSPA